MDQAFDDVITACARSRTESDEGTWIVPEMIEAYCRLHELGYAHSVECWQDEKLVGGLYGLANVLPGWSPLHLWRHWEFMRGYLALIDLAGVEYLVSYRPVAGAGLVPSNFAHNSFFQFSEPPARAEPAGAVPGGDAAGQRGGHDRLRRPPHGRGPAVHRGSRGGLRGRRPGRSRARSSPPSSRSSPRRRRRLDGCAMQSSKPSRSSEAR